MLTINMTMNAGHLFGTLFFLGAYSRSVPHGLVSPDQARRKVKGRLPKAIFGQHSGRIRANSLARPFYLFIYLFCACRNILWRSIPQIPWYWNIKIGNFRRAAGKRRMHTRRHRQTHTHTHTWIVIQSDVNIARTCTLKWWFAKLSEDKSLPLSLYFRVFTSLPLSKFPWRTHQLHPNSNRWRL